MTKTPSSGPGGTEGSSGSHRAGREPRGRAIVTRQLEIHAVGRRGRGAPFHPPGPQRQRAAFSGAGFPAGGGRGGEDGAQGGSKRVRGRDRCSERAVPPRCPGSPGLGLRGAHPQEEAAIQAQAGSPGVAERTGPGPPTSGELAGNTGTSRPPRRWGN